MKPKKWLSDLADLIFKIFPQRKRGNATPFTQKREDIEKRYNQDREDYAPSKDSTRPSSAEHILKEIPVSEN